MWTTLWTSARFARCVRYRAVSALLPCAKTIIARPVRQGYYTLANNEACFDVRAAEVERLSLGRRVGRHDGALRHTRRVFGIRRVDCGVAGRSRSGPTRVGRPESRAARQGMQVSIWWPHAGHAEPNGSSPPAHRDPRTQRAATGGFFVVGRYAKSLGKHVASRGSSRIASRVSRIAVRRSHTGKSISRYFGSGHWSSLTE